MARAKVKRQLKVKRCRVCKTEFRPYTSTQVVCTHGCAMALVNIKHEEKKRKEHNRKKREYFLNDTKHMLKTTQEAFNAWIRKRDDQLPCISCGEVITGQVHAGHYRSVGSQPGLRFNAWNCHAQCAQCNNFRSGNITLYRQNLIDRIGEDLVEYLDLEHKPRKYTALELVSLRKYFKELLKGAE